MYLYDVCQCDLIDLHSLSHPINLPIMLNQNCNGVIVLLYTYSQLGEGKRQGQ